MMTIQILLFAFLFGAAVGQQLDERSCQLRLQECFDNRTAPSVQEPSTLTCLNKTAAFCDNFCPRYGPYAACVEKFRADCSGFRSTSGTFPAVDLQCKNAEKHCRACCATARADPIVVTNAPMTCTERRSFCDKAAARVGITAGCAGCNKFSVTVACRNAAETECRDANWEAVTAVTLRGCAQIEGLCGKQCCFQTVSVVSDCPGSPPDVFGPGGNATTSPTTAGTATPNANGQTAAPATPTTIVVPIGGSSSNSGGASVDASSSNGATSVLLHLSVTWAAAATTVLMV